MPDSVFILAWPLLTCLILSGIHVYLGLHVVERGVIFIDLSLAQVAALGATLAFLAGFDLHSGEAYLFSLVFTIMGAAVFSATRTQKSRIPQEAIIGIVYAIASAAAVLIVDRSPEGAEHIRYILVGNLLAVSPEEVAQMAALYAAIGLLHWIWRGPFLAISRDAAAAAGSGLRVRWWDFLFYASFGVVVTSSVSVAGVLLVFSYLVVPAVAAMLYAETIRGRLLLGWAVAAAVSFLGIALSYCLDTPTGATVVCAFGAVLVVMALLRNIVLIRPR